MGSSARREGSKSGPRSADILPLHRPAALVEGEVVPLSRRPRSRPNLPAFNPRQHIRDIIADLDLPPEQAQAMGYILMGHTRSFAARRVGVHRYTLTRWCQSEKWQEAMRQLRTEYVEGALRMAVVDSRQAMEFCRRVLAGDCTGERAEWLMLQVAQPFVASVLNRLNAGGGEPSLDVLDALAPDDPDDLAADGGGDLPDDACQPRSVLDNHPPTTEGNPAVAAVLVGECVEEGAEGEVLGELAEGVLETPWEEPAPKRQGGQGAGRGRGHNARPGGRRRGGGGA